MDASRISRVVRILMTLQSNQRYNVDNLAKMLGTSRRTIFRDLQELRKATVPLYYDKKRHCYAINQKFFMPPTELSEQEALSLLMLAHKAKDDIHIPFEGLGVLAAMKIENNLPHEIKQYCNNALQNISVRPYPSVRTKVLDKLFHELREAIQKKRVVQISYYLPAEQRCEQIEFIPYHMIYNNHTWHVIGKAEGTRACTLRLDRIEKLSVSEKCFVEDEKFNPQEYIGKAWGVVPDGKLYNVRLKFSAESARDVSEVQWHKTQAVSFGDDGSAVVEFRIDGLNDIVGWILSFGDKVQVLNPEILRNKIIETGKKIIERNEQGS